MPPIGPEKVEEMAVLARISLSESEVHRMAGDLDRILEHVAALAELDTTGVEPTSHVMPLPTPVRPDRAQTAVDPEVALANAPERDGTAFVVPKVIASDEEG